MHIDRTLPVPLGAQLQGYIEYGIAYGDMPPGSKLPSVRELAAELGISPVTVSHVYKALREKELIVTKPGHGTFVRENAQPPERAARRLLMVHKLIDQLALTAEDQGVDLAELTHIVNVRLGAYRAGAHGLAIVFVGIFPEVTKSYAADIRRRLKPFDAVETMVFARLASPAASSRLRCADLVLTFAHRTHQLRDLIGAEPHPARDTPQVAAVNFIPSERTRMLLAELDPLVHLGIISTYPEFLATFRAGISRFAPHVDTVTAAVLGTDQVDHVLASSDVIVYATGSEAIMDGLPRHVRAFEYRHAPDPRHLEQVILPLVEELRSQKQGART